jgi:hypothetical protein
MNQLAIGLSRAASSFGIYVFLITAALAVPAEFQANYDDGFDAGYTVGYDSGFAVGQERGVAEGTKQGQLEGYDSGWDDAYAPAYDLAYTLQRAIGLEQGYDDGVVKGFEEGYEWADSVAQAYNASLGVSGTSGLYSIDFSGITFIRLGDDGVPNWGGPGASGSLAMSMATTSFGIDWAVHYYDEGFKAGKASGLTVGDTAGYDAAYPAAYSSAFGIAYDGGLIAGDAAGTTDGGLDGFDDGWSLGFDEGQPIGFDAGVHFFLYDSFELPPGPAAAAIHGSLPEPSGLAVGSVALIGLVAAALRRPWRAA